MPQIRDYKQTGADALCRQFVHYFRQPFMMVFIPKLTQSKGSYRHLMK